MPRFVVLIFYAFPTRTGSDRTNANKNTPERPSLITGQYISSIFVLVRALSKVRVLLRNSFVGLVLKQNAVLNASVLKEAGS
jgi:hypothetical protein